MCRASAHEAFTRDAFRIAEIVFLSHRLVRGNTQRLCTRVAVCTQIAWRGR